MTKQHIPPVRPKRKAIPVRDRYNVLHAFGFTCAYCGVSSREARLEIDHVLPVSSGGTNDINNLVAACRECNAGKAVDEPVSAEEKMRWAIHSWIYAHDRCGASPETFLDAVRLFVSGGSMEAATSHIESAR